MRKLILFSFMVVAGGVYLLSFSHVFARTTAGLDGNIEDVQNIHFKPAGDAITRYLMQYLQPQTSPQRPGGIRICNGFYSGVVATCDQTESGAIPGFFMDIYGGLGLRAGVLNLGGAEITYNVAGTGITDQLAVSYDGQTWQPIGAGAGTGGGAAAGWVFEEPVIQPQPSLITTAEGVSNRVGINVQGAYPGLATFTVKQPAAYTISNVQVAGNKITPAAGGTTDFFRQAHIGDRITAYVGFPTFPESHTVLSVGLINGIETITVDAAFSQGSGNTRIDILPSIIRVENAAGEVVFGVDGSGNVVGSGWLNEDGVLTTPLGIAVDGDSVFFNKLGVGGPFDLTDPTASPSGNENYGTLTVRGTLDVEAGSSKLEEANIDGVGLNEIFITSPQFKVGDAIRLAQNGETKARTTITYVDASNRAALASAGGLSVNATYDLFKDSRLFEVQNGAGVPKLTMDKSGNINAPSGLNISGGAAIGSYAGVNPAPVNGLIVSGNVGIGTAAPGAKLHVVQTTKLAGNGIKITTPSEITGEIFEGGGTDLAIGATTNHAVNFIQANAPRITLNTNGTVDIGSNPIRFSSAWTASPDSVTNRAEISNDTETFKTLMIVGNKSGGAERRVSIWDRLEVNGKFLINNSQKFNTVKYVNAGEDTRTQCTHNADTCDGNRNAVYTCSVTDVKTCWDEFQEISGGGCSVDSGSRSSRLVTCKAAAYLLAEP
ncbi:MAG: hypothetical protein HYS44_02490 [Candidatus Niyogibacteria bacterium]|nr:hypothetical protein [Candidatus Niyogibacteria bacterium]